MFWQVLVDALPRPPAFAQPALEYHPLRLVSSLSSYDIDTVAKSFADGVSRLLKEGVAELRASFAVLDSAKPSNECTPCMGSKFELPPQVTLSSKHCLRFSLRRMTKCSDHEHV